MSNEVLAKLVLELFINCGLICCILNRQRCSKVKRRTELKIKKPPKKIHGFFVVYFLLGGGYLKRISAYQHCCNILKK